jgi:iron complex transport system substrate-binding protein
MGWQWFLGVGLIALIVTACSGTTIDHGRIPTPKLSSTPCRMVQHPMGKTCIPSKPQRIIIISYEILGHALTLGVKPIGSNYLRGELNSTYISDQSYLGNKVEEVKNIGFSRSPNIEKILELKPDLILAWEDAEQIYPMLSKIAPTVLISVALIEANWKTGFRVVAELLGKEEKAQQVLNHYNQRIEQLKMALSNRYQDKTVSVAFAYGQNAYVYAKNSFVGSILEDLELKRPSAQDIFVDGGRIDGISDEKLDLLDGDILFFGVSDLGHSEAYENLKQKPLWKNLKVVQEGQVYLFDVNTWAGNSPLAADVVIDDLYKYLVRQYTLNPCPNTPSLSADPATVPPRSVLKTNLPMALFFSQKT